MNEKQPRYSKLVNALTAIVLAGAPISGGFGVVHVEAANDKPGKSTQTTETPNPTNTAKPPEITPVVPPTPACGPTPTQTTEVQPTPTKPVCGTPLPPEATKTSTPVPTSTATEVVPPTQEASPSPTPTSTATPFTEIPTPTPTKKVITFTENNLPPKNGGESESNEAKRAGWGLVLAVEFLAATLGTRQYLKNYSFSAENGKREE